MTGATASYCFIIIVIFVIAAMLRLNVSQNKSHVYVIAAFNDFPFNQNTDNEYIQRNLQLIDP